MIAAPALARSYAVRLYLPAVAIVAATVTVAGPGKAVLGVCYAILFLAAAVDARTNRIPNVFTYSGVLLVIVASAVAGNIGSALIGGVAGFAVFLLLHIVSRGAIGLGDAKLTAFGGALVGGQMLVGALLVGSLSAVLPVAVLLLTHRIDRKQPIPYGPYLAFGFALVALAVGTTV